MSRKITIFLALSVVSLGLFATGCPRVSQGTVTGTVSCPPGARCTRTVSGSVTIVFFQEFNQSEQQVGIFDLSKEWVPVDTPSPTVFVRIADGGGQFAEQQFALTRVDASGISPVDKDTTPVAYIYSDPAAVEDFFTNNASLMSNEDSEVEMNFSVAIQRTNCRTPTGTYPNHIRYQDASGITYFNSLKFNYTAPPQIGMMSCEEGTLEFVY